MSDAFIPSDAWVIAVPVLEAVLVAVLIGVGIGLAIAAWTSTDA